MSYTALLPVKALAQAKSRLAPHLSPHQRQYLVLEMLQHVLHVLHASEAFEHITVVSADEHVLSLSRAWGARGLIEEQPGHNPALRAAALHESAHGTTALLTLSADLPLLNTNDIWYMIDTAAHYDVVLAPSQDGTGTNALLVRPPLAVPYVFGPNSLARFHAEAGCHHLRSAAYLSQGLSLDIDTIADLQALQRYREEEDRNHALQERETLTDVCFAGAAPGGLPFYQTAS